MFAAILLIICIFFGALGQIFMKNGMSHIGEINNIADLFNFSFILDMLQSWQVIIGLLLYAIAAFLWLGALSTLNVSFMYPLLSLGYIITAILAFAFLKEDITLLRWVGIIVIVIGCFLTVRA